MRRAGEVTSQKSGDLAEASAWAETPTVLRGDQDLESEAFHEVDAELVNSLSIRDFEVRSHR